jgi:hypothetical protein
MCVFLPIWTHIEYEVSDVLTHAIATSTVTPAEEDALRRNYLDLIAMPTWRDQFFMVAESISNQLVC